MAIAAIAISLTFILHEGIHAITCTLHDGRLCEFSTYRVVCDPQTAQELKLISGSATIINFLLSIFLWILLDRTRKMEPKIRFFLWVLMLMNWVVGVINIISAGVLDEGDLAIVIDGWRPSWLWHTLMTVIGLFLYLLFCWLTLKTFCKMIVGSIKEKVYTARKISLLSYVTYFLIVFPSSYINSIDTRSSTVIDTYLLGVFGLFPQFWIMPWLQKGISEKTRGKTLEIKRDWWWIVSAVIVVFIFFFLSRTTSLGCSKSGSPL